MRRVLALALVLAVVPAAAAATARERQIGRTDLERRRRRVPMSPTRTSTSTRCHEIRLWNVATRSDRRLASHCFVSTSTGSGVAGVIATQGRALWLTYTGGNIREWSLWTKGGLAKAQRIAFLPADVDGPPPVILGSVWEGSLPYATGRTIVVLAPNGSRRFSFTAADRVVYLSAHSRGYAAVLANGSVLTFSTAGRLIRAAHVRARGRAGRRARRPGPDRRDGRRIGDSRRRADPDVPLPPSARFLGYSQGIVAYGLGRELRLRRLADGHDSLFRTLEPQFHAQLGRRGLAYASGRDARLQRLGDRQRRGLDAARPGPRRGRRRAGGRR